MLNERYFLADARVDCPQLRADPQLRAKLWAFFQAAEKSGQDLNPNAVPITSVSVGGPCWTNGEIRILLDSDNEGVIFHEVGHAFFEGSILHTSGNNDWWGDAFCDAFRYCMEKTHCPQSLWMNKFPDRTEGRYQYPASLILNRCGSCDFAGLKALWRPLAAKSRRDGFLSQEFDYVMPQP